MFDRCGPKLIDPVEVHGRNPHPSALLPYHPPQACVIAQKFFPTLHKHPQSCKPFQVPLYLLHATHKFAFSIGQMCAQSPLKPINQHSAFFFNNQNTLTVYLRSVSRDMPLFKECKIQSLQQPQNKFRKEALQTDKQVEGRYSSGSRDLHKAGVILL